MFTKFTTSAERHYVLKSIKEDCILPACFDKFDRLYWHISKMVSKDPEERPDLRGIVDEYRKSGITNAHELELQRLNARIKYLEYLLFENGIKCP